MDKFAYQNAIAFFTTARNLAATPEILGQLCPHLTAGEIKIIIRKAKLQKRGYYFALPPLLIDGVVTAASIDPACTRKGARHPATINFAFSQEVSIKSVAYSKRALAFARRHWGDSLVEDQARSFVTFILQDSTKLNKHGYPTTVAVVHITTGRDWNAINNDRSAPHSQLVNDSILHVTRFKSISAEMKKGRGGFTSWCCSNCGGGLSLTACSACCSPFKDDQYRCGWDTPLPAKVVEYLKQHGHRFAVDPAIAQKLEIARWSRDHSRALNEATAEQITELKRQLEEATKVAESSASQLRTAHATITESLGELLEADNAAKQAADQKRLTLAEKRKTGDLELARQRKEAGSAKSRKPTKLPKPPKPPKPQKPAKRRRKEHIPNPGH